MDIENMDVAEAGPMVRMIDTRSWAIPLVAPSEARFGEAATI